MSPSCNVLKAQLLTFYVTCNCNCSFLPYPYLPHSLLLHRPCIQLLAKLLSCAPNNTYKERRIRRRRMENGFSNPESQQQEVATSSEPPTYEEAFPPLGSPTLPGPDPMFPAGASYGRGAQSAWPVKSIPSSSVTQVRSNRVMYWRWLPSHKVYGVLNSGVE